MSVSWNSFGPQAFLPFHPQSFGLGGPAGPDAAQNFFGALALQSLAFAAQDVFERGGGGHAQAFAMGQGMGNQLPYSPSLAAELRRQMQQINQTGLGFPSQDPLSSLAGMQVSPEQAAQLLQLFIMYLMMNGGRPNEGNGAGRSGGGGGCGCMQPLSMNGLRGLPSSPGRDLGPLNAGVPMMPGSANGISAAQLRQVAPNLSAARAQELVPHLNAAMQEAGITTQRQQAAFIAQLAQESGGFVHFRELADGRAYEGRRDLGNTQPGDGPRYKGRGPIQLTGRANYRAAGQALGLPLEQNPDLVSRPDVGFRVAAWYWQNRGLNDVAERGDFREVTRRINGGYNGYDVRLSYYNRALSVVA